MVVERAAMPANRLLGVIETQTEIVRLGSDLAGVMSLVAGRALALTHAVGAVVELAEGDDMVYRLLRVSPIRTWACGSHAPTACPACASRSSGYCVATIPRPIRAWIRRRVGTSACAR